MASDANSAVAAPEAPEARAPETVRIGMSIARASLAGGGVTEALRSLTRALDRRPGVAVEVFSSFEAGTDAAIGWGDARLHDHPVRGPMSFAWTPALTRSLASRPIELLHLHGLWMYPSVAARRWTVESGRPCLISPHGMLDPWALANSGWKKRIARRLYEDENLRHAACLHALCEAELQAIRDFGLRHPVCLVPNGVDSPPAEAPAPPAWRQALPAQARVLLYLGRLHPKKGLLELLEAWHLAGLGAPAATPWHLVVAGPGPADYVSQLERRVECLDLGGRVRLIGPQYGADKQATLAAADAFVLPSFSEGLPMAALEAWAWGLPALLTPQCNLPEGFSAGAALRIEPGAEGIAAGLRLFVALPEERQRAMGQRGRALAATRFSWAQVATEFEAVYRWLLGKGEQPACVELA